MNLNPRAVLVWVSIAVLLLVPMGLPPRIAEAVWSELPRSLREAYVLVFLAWLFLGGVVALTLDRTDQPDEDETRCYKKKGE